MRLRPLRVREVCLLTWGNDGCYAGRSAQIEGAHSVNPVSLVIDRVDATFDDETLVADAGLIVPATLMARVGIEELTDSKVRLVGRVGGARPGRKLGALVAAILDGGSHIDHADRLRAGSTQKVLPFRVMALAVVHVRPRPPTRRRDRRDDPPSLGAGRRPWRSGDDDRCALDDL